MRLNSRIAAILAVVALSGQARASMTQFLLQNANTNPPFANGQSYFGLTILDGTDAAGVRLGSYTTTAADVVFEVTPLAALTQFSGPPGNKFGIDEFAFNTTNSLSMYSSANFVLPSNWSVAMGKNGDGYGMFDLLPGGNNGANTVANPLIFAITNISGDGAGTYEKLSTKNAGQGNVDFATHLINISDPAAPGTTSAWFGGQTPVPLPAAGWLLLSGLGALAAHARSRRVRSPRD
jgi:hypothetical protein